MRPRIVEYLNQIFETDLFTWLVPGPALIYALAIFVGLLVYVRRCSAVGLSRYHCLGAAIWAMVGGLVGARLLYLLLHLDSLLTDPGMLFDLNGGTISWGAYLFGGLGFWLYFAVRRGQVRPYADVLSTCLGLGPFIGRWSCFLNGDDFGTFTHVPWAVAYPNGSMPFLAQVNSGHIESAAILSLPVHPVQIYLSLNGLFLFLLLSWLWKQRRFTSGIIFYLYWAVYTGTRFLLEYFRDTTYIDTIGPFSVTQAIAMLVFGGALFAIMIVSFNHYFPLVKSRNPIKP